MNPPVLLKWRRILGAAVPLALALCAPPGLSTLQPAAAATPEFVAVADLSPRLERMRALLARRLDLVLARHRADLQGAVGRCAAGQGSACRLEDWRAFLAGLSDDDEAGRIYRVHRFVNRFRYVSDRRNWRRADFWAAPEQLFERGGDCEDYVIAKYLSLRALGIAPDRMRIVVVYDRRKRGDHAVLAVFGPAGTMVLDNRHRRVMTWAEMRERYRPYYSLNEASVWIHDTGI